MLTALITNDVTNKLNSGKLLSLQQNHMGWTIIFRCIWILDPLKHKVEYAKNDIQFKTSTIGSVLIMNISTT